MITRQLLFASLHSRAREVKCPQLENFTILFFKAFPYLSYVLGWGVYDATGEQSRYLRQVYLTVNTSITDCGCTADYYIQTNVGPRGEDPCSGDSGGDFPI